MYLLKETRLAASLTPLKGENALGLAVGSVGCGLIVKNCYCSRGEASLLGTRQALLGGVEVFDRDDEYSLKALC